MHTYKKRIGILVPSPPSSPLLTSCTSTNASPSIPELSWVSKATWAYGYFSSSASFSFSLFLLLPYQDQSKAMLLYKRGTNSRSLRWRTQSHTQWIMKSSRRRRRRSRTWVQDLLHRCCQRALSLLLVRPHATMTSPTPLTSTAPNLKKNLKTRFEFINLLVPFFFFCLVGKY